MPVPDFQSIMLPLLKITTDGQEHKQGEIKDKLALQFQLNDIDQGEKLPGGGLRFDNNVAWSVVYLRKAGLLENSKRGIFHITEQGRETLKTNPTKIDIKYLKQYPSFKKWQEASNDPVDPLTKENVVIDDDSEILYLPPSEIDPKNAPSSWIFQANPKSFDLEQDLKGITAQGMSDYNWTVNQYIKRIHPGDIVYLWTAGKNAGILAAGTITSEPYPSKADPNLDFIAERKRTEGTQLWVNLRIDHILSERIKREDLLDHPILRSMQIITRPQGTNFSLTKEEADALNTMIFGLDTSSLPELPALIQSVQSILERKGQVILYGPPGTGKTYWAEKAACELSARSSFGKTWDQLSKWQRSDIISDNGSGLVRICCFHPAYGYEDFIEGYWPQNVKTFGRSSDKDQTEIQYNYQMTYVLRDGIFKRLCKDAQVNPSQKFYLIIDEINRGDIPRIFGELMMVLEKNKRGKSVLLPLSGEPFKIPMNIYIIGTMNTADRSIALLDIALQRRFGRIPLMPDAKVLGDTTIEGIPLGQWLEAINNRICKAIGYDARNLQIGHSYLLEDGKPINDFGTFSKVIREDVIPLLEEYCYEDYSKLEEILGNIVVNSDKQQINEVIFDESKQELLSKAFESLISGAEIDLNHEENES